MKKRTNARAACLALLLLTGCAGSGEKSARKDDYFHGDGQTVELTHTPLKGLRTGDGIICCPEIVGDSLLITDRFLDSRYWMNRFSVAGDSLSDRGAFLHNGRGPKEMITYSGTAFDRHTRTLYFAETANGRFRQLTIDLSQAPDAHTATDLWETTEIPARFGVIYESVCWAAPDRLLCIPLDDSDYLFTSIDLSSGSATYLDMKYPEQLMQFQPFDRYQILSYRMLSPFGKNRFLVSSRTSKYIFLFSVEGNRIKELVRLSEQFPVYTPTDGSGKYPYRLGGRQEAGCSVLAVTDRYVYIGYDNRSLAETWQESHIGNQVSLINVFDWQGRFVTRLSLDLPVIAFAVSDDDRTLYATHVDTETEESAILRYELPL